MTLRQRVHPEAEAEFLDAVRYYATTEAGLGDELDFPAITRDSGVR